MGDNEVVHFNIRIRTIDKISPALVGKSVILVVDYDGNKFFCSPTTTIKQVEEDDAKTKKKEISYKVEWEKTPIFDFALEVKKSKLATSKTLCSICFKMRSLDLKKKTQKTIGKWKVDLYRFYKKTEFINTALIKSDTKPRIIINVVDVKELAKKKQTGVIDHRFSHIDFTAKPELQEKKKSGLFSKKSKKDKSGESSDEDSECDVHSLEDDEDDGSKSKGGGRKNAAKRLSGFFGKDKDKSSASKDEKSSEDKKKKKDSKSSKSSKDNSKSEDDSSISNEGEMARRAINELKQSYDSIDKKRRDSKDRSEESSESKRRSSSSSKKSGKSSKSKRDESSSEDSDNPMNWASEQSDSEVSASLGQYRVEEVSYSQDEKSSSKSKKRESVSIKRQSSTSSLSHTEKKSSHHHKDKVATTEPSSNLFSLESEISGNEDVSSAKIYKVIIIGDASVGKSQLLGRWIENKFSNNILPTVYIEFSSKSFMADGKAINVQFWDTAGQERFNALTRQYYNKSQGAVIVYSIDDRSSFDAVNRWLSDLKAQNVDAEVLLVGNKKDLEDTRKVSTREGMDLAKRNGISFLETSALDGTNCTKAMQIILQDIHKKQPDNTLEGCEKQESKKSKEASKSEGIVILHEEPPKSSKKPSREKSSSKVSHSSNKRNSRVSSSATSEEEDEKEGRCCG